MNTYYNVPNTALKSGSSPHTYSLTLPSLPLLSAILPFQFLRSKALRSSLTSFLPLHPIPNQPRNPDGAPSKIYLESYHLLSPTWLDHYLAPGLLTSPSKWSLKFYSCPLMTVSSQHSSQSDPFKTLGRTCYFFVAKPPFGSQFHIEIKQKTSEGPARPCLLWPPHPSDLISSSSPGSSCTAAALASLLLLTCTRCAPPQVFTLFVPLPGRL